ncbi:spore germination lipoprotein GerD [Saliterribacillus persicus]|uniref:Spore germination protein D n=1 Tax=Saliterribacillus persicus TaxID=930114 RepID=A0A368X954_9BACI|nr:spore germination lipoprotein GerD [Saliterribacillus persicus]RCW63528.1 spore germination protein D [Saliterribacillus persicus]
MVPTRKLKGIVVIIILCLITACTGGSPAANKEADYDTTKKMVADILKTDEGKKAITEVLASDDMQQTYVIDAKVVEEAITSLFSSDKGKEFWQKMFTDPAFIESFATSLQDQQEKVMQGLMSDPKFQGKMMEILGNPKMQEQTLQVLKSQPFREHLEKTIQETFESPMMQATIAEIVLNAAKEMKPEESGGSQEESSGGGEGGQEEGGGGSESGGGGESGGS